MLEYKFACSDNQLQEVGNYADELNLKPCDCLPPVKTWRGHPFSDDGALMINYNSDRESKLQVDIWHKEAVNSLEVKAVIDKIRQICGEALSFSDEN